jgi:hypothetical protein
MTPGRFCGTEYRFGKANLFSVSQLCQRRCQFAIRDLHGQHAARGRGGDCNGMDTMQDILPGSIVKPFGEYQPQAVRTEVEMTIIG